MTCLFMPHQFTTKGVSFVPKRTVPKYFRELKYTRSSPDRNLANDFRLRAIEKQNEDIPLQQRLLSGFLSLSSTPYSLYMPSPRTFLHTVDPRIKQIGTAYLLFLIFSAGMYGKLSIAVWVLVVTLINTPWRISKPTLLPLIGLVTFYFVLTASLADGAPPGLQLRTPTANLENLPLIEPKPYKYVLFNFAFINITKKSIRLGLFSLSFIFVSLQSASLCLITTPPEQLALSLRQLLSPLRVFRLPVEEIGFCLLLSVRFLTTVFDEVRNLALGVAVRGVDWKQLGVMGSINLMLNVVAQLFRKLFQTTEKVAQALVVRGFVGPKMHELYLLTDVDSSWKANVLTVAMLVLLTVVALSIG